MNIIGLEGTALTSADYDNLQRRWISRELADRAYLRRVDSAAGAQIVVRNDFKGDYSGIAIPYILPDESRVREYRLRRDHPEIDQDPIRGRRERNKYLSPPGGKGMIYFPPAITAELLSNGEVPVIVTEGEFKTLALWRLAWETADDTSDIPPFVPLGIAGVNNWRCHERRDAPEGGTEQVSVPLPDFDRVALANRKVLVMFDKNVATNSNVRFERRRFTQFLQDRGAIVSWFEWPESTPEQVNGIDDFLAMKGSGPALKQIYRCIERPLDRKPWKMELQLNQGGSPLQHVLNAITALRHAPEWQGALAFNEFSLQIEVVQDLPIGLSAGGRYQDVHDTATAAWLQRYGLNVSSRIVSEAIAVVAQDNIVHPVRAYLEALRWDGVKRLNRWLMAYLGAADAPASYLASIGAQWLISAVARIFRPGCKADCCLILEGLQGIRKSTALRMLTPRAEWFTDELCEIGSKDASMQLNGVWIVEISELDAISRADVSKIKAFLSRTIERFRPPYGRHVIERPRQCVFAGTVNQSGYLRDETGNRRFWPFQAGVIDTKAIERDRDQLWAEAVRRYQAGEQWWLDERTSNIAAAEQEQRAEEDPWQNDIEAYLANNAFEWTTITLLANGAVGKKLDTLEQRDANRISRVLRKLGWTRRQVRIPQQDKREWRYYRPEASLE